jgi:uncharacterized DUF497 family protein
MGVHKTVEFEFDAAKDAANIAKHGVPLSWGVAFEFRAVVKDERRDYGEERFNGFGLIDGVTYCMTFTVRGDIIRIISLRRARAKEYRRHVD